MQSAVQKWQKHYAGMIDGESWQRLNALVRYVAEARVNVTAWKGEDLWEIGVGPSLAVLGLVPQWQHLLDVGSGGGFPGLVLAAVRPQLPVDLVESRQRRAAFLCATYERLGLEKVRVHHVRAENWLAPEGAGRERYDLITVRAVGSLRLSAEISVPGLVLGGHAVIIRGAGAAEELRREDTWIEALGGQSQGWERLADGRGYLCVMEKKTATSVMYPRHGSHLGR